MAHIAVVVPVWVGHLNPMTMLARALANSGHQISILSFPEAAPRIARAGLDHHVIGSNLFPAGEWERRTRQLSVLTRFSAARYTIQWLGDITRVMLAELPALLSAGKFDGLLMDQVCYGAELAADQHNLPVTVACNALPIHFEPDLPVHSETWPYNPSFFAQLRNRLVQHLIMRMAQPFVAQLRSTRLERGQPWDPWNYVNHLPPSLAQVAQLPKCLDFPRSRMPEHFHHTGPWHDHSSTHTSEFDYPSLDQRPLIYASLGTLQNGLDHLYQTILDACADLPAQVVLALGRENGTPPRRIPPNATVLGYAPQLDLLKRASLVITHAGMNTTLESLALGLPMVALPIANEQPGIAARIRHAGVGEWLSIHRLSPARLRATLLHLLNNPSYRQNARACASEIAKQNGLSRAASIIEQAILERKPVLRTSAPATPDLAPAI